MPKLSDAIIGKGNIVNGSSSYGMNLQYGGQGGHMMAFGRNDNGGGFADEWMNNHAYVRRNLIPVVISCPGFFQFMPNKDQLVAMYKAMIEIKPLNIDGLSSGLTVETDQHPIGGAGEQQDEITNVTRAVSSLSFTYKELAGKSISKFLDFIIRYGYQDPDTKVPLVRNYVQDASSFGGLYLPDMYTGTVLFIEPDLTQLSVVDAWLCSNMIFKSNGERTGKRDIHSAGETVEHSIESTAITLNNDAVLALADTILKNMAVIKKIPETGIIVPSSISSDVAAVKGYDQ